jgi:uncharacterized membrane protein
LNQYIEAPHWFLRVRAITKLGVCVVMGVIGFLAFLPVSMEGTTRVMVAWDVFSLSMIILYFTIFASIQPKQLRVLASKEDESRTVVFIIVVIATMGSLGGVLLLLRNQSGWLLSKGLETFIYILGVTCSWVLLHTLFTTRYAHLYYGDHATLKGQMAGGLDIPNEKCPDYLDFAYFSFVIGMTFQVSDIQISSRYIRRVALLHGMLSFLFNTVIVALTINVVVDLQSK